MLLGPNDTIRNLHGHIHHYSVPIENVVNVGVDAPERDLLKKNCHSVRHYPNSKSKKYMKQRGREKADLHQVIRTGNQKQLLVFLIWQDLSPQMQAFEPAAQFCVTRNKMEKQFAACYKRIEVPDFQK